MVTFSLFTAVRLVAKVPLVMLARNNVPFKEIVSLISYTVSGMLKYKSTWNAADTVENERAKTKINPMIKINFVSLLLTITPLYYNVETIVTYIINCFFAPFLISYYI
ncbi:hypothetical protein CL622_04290 [archaeon]|nr:hypothetical protein [archaeon]